MSLSQLPLYERGIKARNALWASFFLLGFAGLAWVPRIPEIKDSLGLSDGQFGLVLLGSTLGAIPGAQLAGRIVHTHSSKLVIRISGILLPVGVTIMGVATSVTTLLIGLFITGFNVAFMDIAINSQAIAIEKHTQARWMSTFHGLWSVGAFAATLVGGLIANFVTPQANLIGISILTFLAFFVVNHYLLPADLDGHLGHADEVTQSKVPLFSKEAMVLWALGIGLMASLIPEGGAYEWSGILLQDHMGIGKGLNAAAATSFSLAMIVSRLLGDKSFERWGYVNTVKYGGYFGGGIWGLSLLIGIPLSDTNQMLSLIIVCIGFAAAGLGMGPFFPAFNLAAASIPGVAPSVGLARIGIIAIAAYFAGPTLMGGIAELTSLPIAFGLPVFLFFLAGYQSRHIKVRNLKH
uniref:MFS transporter n=1 Tax=Candidatus Planktophila sp. TaxID=2175601 RepID=UPI0040495D50